MKRNNLIKKRETNLSVAKQSFVIQSVIIIKSQSVLSLMLV